MAEQPKDKTNSSEQQDPEAKKAAIARELQERPTWNFAPPSLHDVRSFSTSPRSLLERSYIVDGDSLEKINDDIEASLRELVPRFQVFLNQKTREGTAEDSFEANQRLASMIQATANRLELLFRCPTCGEPARLRCKRMDRAPNGLFLFEHAAQRTTHASSKTLPKLILVPEK